MTTLNLPNLVELLIFCRRKKDSRKKKRKIKKGLNTLCDLDSKEFFPKSSIPKTETFIKLRKMITTVLSIILLTCIFFASSNRLWTINPVKIASILVLVGSRLFCYLGVTKGSSWLFLLMLMLFLGGIMIVFIIMASLTPNEPSLPSKFRAFALAALFFASTAYISGDRASQLKWFCISSRNIQIMIMLIVGYFISFIWIVSIEKTSIRTSVSCRVEKFFVKIYIKSDNNCNPKRF